MTHSALAFIAKLLAVGKGQGRQSDQLRWPRWPRFLLLLLVFRHPAFAEVHVGATAWPFSLHPRSILIVVRESCFKHERRVSSVTRVTRARGKTTRVESGGTPTRRSLRREASIDRGGTWGGGSKAAKWFWLIRVDDEGGGEEPDINCPCCCCSSSLLLLLLLLLRFFFTPLFLLLPPPSAPPPSALPLELHPLSATAHSSPSLLLNPDTSTNLPNPSPPIPLQPPCRQAQRRLTRSITSAL